MLDIALIGYGKMGQAIERVALQRGHQISLRLSRENRQELSSSSLAHVDVAIEFTSPKNAADNILFCLENGTPVICGTTGWLQRMPEVEAACNENHGTFLYASNFSIGVNIFFEINKKLAALMKNQTVYDVRLKEIHHKQKKDAPSGTAITLAEQILDEIPRKTKWSAFSASPEELLIESERIDEVPGTHIVTYVGNNDQIEITHTAFDRMGFAFGAVLAAEFIAGKKGLFTMKEVLGL